MKRVCVFCGSSAGRGERYMGAARTLGTAIGRRGIDLVYGGACIGLMGAVADAVLAAGGKVYGVIPRGLEAREVAHRGLTELHVVASMHERKALMADLADAFVAMPGGFGTLDELFEIATWAQLGLHDKPIALLDVDDFFAPLRAMVGRAVQEGFVAATFAGMFPAHTDAEALLDALAGTVSSS